MTILLLKIAFVLFVLCMDVLILTWCLKVTPVEAILLMLYVGAACMVFIAFCAALLCLVRDIL